MESVANEMRQYLEMLKEGFNPSSPADLQALLYLVYFEYNTLGQRDPAFIMEIKKLIELIKDAESGNMNNCGDPRHEEFPRDCGCPAPFDGPMGPGFDGPGPRDFGPMGGPENGPRGPMGPEFGPMGPRPDEHSPVRKFMHFGARRLFLDDNNRMPPKDIFGFGPEDGPHR